MELQLKFYTAINRSVTVHDPDLIEFFFHLLSMTIISLINISNHSKLHKSIYINRANITLFVQHSSAETIIVHFMFQRNVC